MDIHHNSHPHIGASASAEMNAVSKLGSHPKHHFFLECYRKDGTLRWWEEFDNLVTTAGKNKYLDATLKTGLAAPAWYVGLKGAGTVVAADTMASHAGWTEVTDYSQAARPTWTPGAISNGSVDNSASKAVFSINATTTIAGSFLADNSTKGGNTGTLLGAGDFANSRSMYSGDTLNVTVTCSQT